MEKNIVKRIKNYKKEVSTFFNKINEFDRIAVFRHDHPDYDAFGSQLGVVEFIKTNFKNKEVIYVGDNHVSLSSNCFPKMMEIDDSWFEKPFLSIVVDVSNTERISDERYKKGTYIIKIDHHPFVDKYADLEIIDETMVAAGEFLATIFMSKNYKISEKCAGYLWKAIVGDSGRFLYSDTTSHTFLIAKNLLETGINIHQLYTDMYQENIEDLQVRKFILDNYKLTKKGVAYYVLTDNDLKKFNMLPLQGKDNINLFAHFKEIKIWVSCTEDKEKGNWRVSIRSSSIQINKVAEKHNGGGHANASGCKLKSVDELESLIRDLDNLIS